MNQIAKSPQGLEVIPDDQWAFYKEVIDAARSTGEPFALGGAFAWAAYTGLYRNTKDIDLYVQRGTEKKFAEVLVKIGATDYFETLGYDRGWIYRSTRDGYIADIIFDSANYTGPVDRDSVTQGPELEIRGEKLRIIPAEELMMNKLYILQRSRCDWFDVFNILYATLPDLDWERLILKMGENRVLLSGALQIFCWLCPGSVGKIPEDLWGKLGMLRPASGEQAFDPQRVAQLDSRPWFLPALKPGEKIFVASG